MKYDIIENWGRIPDGWDLVNIPAVGVDSADRVYLFSRCEHPVLVFDRQGNFLNSWGEGVFARPHGICIGPDDSVYCVDDYDHTLRKFRPDGKLVMTIGVANKPSDTGCKPGDYFSVKWGGPPFNRPTSVALSPDGDIYVTDGYLNARVHRFSAAGEHLQSWGEPGSEPGQFRLPHGICVDRTGNIYVGDRMNSRVQIFGPRGHFIGQWDDVYQPNDLCIDQHGNIVIAELGYEAGLPMCGPRPTPEDSYSRVTIRNSKGQILYKVTNADRSAPGGFLAAHGIRTDSRGDIYVTEVSEVAAKKRGLDRHKFHLVQKLVRVAD